jgi:hypothetical protein
MGVVRVLQRGAVAILIVLAGALVSLPPASGAGNTGNSGIASSKTCKPFVATKWVNPYPPNEKGKHYQVVVTGSAFTCATADALVVKFVAEKIKPLPKMPAIGKVSGAPAGYKCTSGIAHNHTAYQGNCQALQPTPSSSSFSWGPYNDS